MPGMLEGYRASIHTSGYEGSSLSSMSLQTDGAYSKLSKIPMTPARRGVKQLRAMEALPSLAAAQHLETR